MRIRELHVIIETNLSSRNLRDFNRIGAVYKETDRHIDCAHKMIEWSKAERTNLCTIEVNVHLMVRSDLIQHTLQRDFEFRWSICSRFGIRRVQRLRERRRD